MYVQLTKRLLKELATAFQHHSRKTAWLPYALAMFTAAAPLTSREKGSFLISSSVLFWYLRISRSATVPGLYRGFSADTSHACMPMLHQCHACFASQTASLAGHLLLVVVAATGEGLPWARLLGVPLTGVTAAARPPCRAAPGRLGEPPPAPALVGVPLPLRGEGLAFTRAMQGAGAVSHSARC